MQAFFSFFSGFFSVFYAGIGRIQKKRKPRFRVIQPDPRSADFKVSRLSGGNPAPRAEQSCLTAYPGMRRQNRSDEEECPFPPADVRLRKNPGPAKGPGRSTESEQVRIICT